MYLFLSIALLVGTIFFLTKKKGIGQILMFAGQLVKVLFMLIGSILSLLMNKGGIMDYDVYFMVSKILGTIGSLGTLAFIIGFFILVFTFDKEKNTNS